MKYVVWLLLATYVILSLFLPGAELKSKGLLRSLMGEKDRSDPGEMDLMDVKREQGDFRELHTAKLPQEDLPLDSRLYIAPNRRITGDRDYDDGKGY